jgi:hypothetical protein
MRAIFSILISIAFLTACKTENTVPAALGNRHESQALGLCMEFGMTRDINLKELTCEAK